MRVDLIKILLVLGLVHLHRLGHIRRNLLPLKARKLVELSRDVFSVFSVPLLLLFLLKVFTDELISFIFAIEPLSFLTAMEEIGGHLHEHWHVDRSFLLLTREGQNRLR